MTTTQKIWDLLMGDSIVQALGSVMAENFEDFAESKQKYIDAIAALQESLNGNASISPQEEAEAIQRQSASSLLFSGLLGLKANRDHFIDPVARTFLEVDSELYLREEMAHMLPGYVSAQETRNRFYAQLSPVQQKLYEDVNTYACYLETVGPKLAHYYGYILGNELLQRVIPGYHPDYVLTRKYTAMLETYFGISFTQITAALL